MGTLELYGYAAAAVLTTVTLLWIVSVAIRDASIIDVFWGPLFVAIAWVLLAANLHSVGIKHLLVVFLVTAWGLRLAFHLAARNFGNGEDVALPLVARARRRALVVENLLSRLSIAGCDRVGGRNADRRGISRNRRTISDQLDRPADLAARDSSSKRPPTFSSPAFAVDPENQGAGDAERTLVLHPTSELFRRRAAMVGARASSRSAA